MSQEEQPLKVEEVASDKKSGSTKATIEAQKRQDPPLANNEGLIIEQIRSELEQYFAPQNLQNDFNLRQQMTADGYIDIDLLLDLKLMQDLVSNRDILIEAISRSKLLVMNSGCTMVKYMPLLERNVLILRDIPSSTQKEEILAIFANEHCSTPSEVHSDIGNNWFCRFKTEEQCLQTAKYLQQFGVFKEEKLHVRVKAILDKNKADTSPQMAPSPPTKPKIPPPTAMPGPPIGAYPPGYYQSGGYGYYGQSGAAPMDPYYYASPKSGGRPKRNNREHRDHRDREREREREPETVAKGDITPPITSANASGDKVTGDEERTAMSDYPGVFDKYTQEEFVEIYKNMKTDELMTPQSMRGRDLRIISEEVLPPIRLQKKEKEKEDEDDTKKRESKAKKAKEKKAKKQQRKKEISGTYYEEDVYDEPYYEEDAYWDNGYRDQDASAYYYEDGRNAKGAYYYNYDSQRASYGGRGTQERYYDDGYYESQRKQGGRKQQQQRRGGGGDGAARTGARTYRSQRSNKNRDQQQQWSAKNRDQQPQWSAKNRDQQPQPQQQQQQQQQPQWSNKKTSGVHWSPRQQKEYSTNKGVYRTKVSTSSSAY